MEKINGGRGRGFGRGFGRGRGYILKHLSGSDENECRKPGNFDPSSINVASSMVGRIIGKLSLK